MGPEPDGGGISSVGSVEASSGKGLPGFIKPSGSISRLIAFQTRTAAPASFAAADALKSIGIPEHLENPLWLVIGLHFFAFTFWAVFFVKDVVKPPLHPIQAEALKKKNS